MNATVLHGARDLRVEEMPDAKILEPTDAMIRVVCAYICGSDLWPDKNLDPSDRARVMGHEAFGIVEDIGPDVRTVNPGDLGAAPNRDP